MPKAVQRLINSVWTIEYNPVDKDTIQILRYSREDEEGYFNEHRLPHGYLIEDDKRIVRAANIGGKHYTVKNQQHVFTYQLTKGEK